ncbi:DUF3047 domain-containing protein [Falsihalocynthiibacter sp. BN13B15]|uniref:DUF3047 domain-containing protein n=1 Tax=Falsihalocynthiibacter sp. BN13B15 TaxID=3240871 RepID=UPI00351094F8
MKAILIFVLAFGLTATETHAMFFGNWIEQKFSLFSSNKWTQSRQGVRVISDGSVSLLWTRLPASDSSAVTAKWNWSVDNSVPPTTLSKKGGDDRNLALYFVFVPPEVAEKNRNSNIRKLLKVNDARILMYVWGGNYARGDIVPSPYLGMRGKTIILRSAGTGEFGESVDLAADYKRAFGEPKTVLVGLAVSSDSDDTKTMVRARLQDLRIE